MDGLEDGIDPNDPAQARADTGNEHREPRFSEPAHHAARVLHESAEELEAAEPAHPDEAVVDDVLIRRVRERR